MIRAGAGSGPAIPRAAIRGPVRAAMAALAAAVVLAAAPLPARAQFTLIDRDATRLVLGGYLRSFTAVHDRGYDLPDLPGIPAQPRESGFHGEVLRLKWQLEGEGWRVDVHDRFQARVSSSDAEGSVLGFGVSAVPGRLVDLDTDFLDRTGLRVWHDVDRLSLTLYTSAADLTVGRQAITWGTSALFPVADLWAQFSPFELDTEEKPGIDAVRALFYPVEGLEMDAVMADRGASEDLSVGLRGTYALTDADVWLGAGKFWRQLLAMGGVTLLFDETKLRAEAVVPWHLDDQALQDPRLTLGVDWIRGTLALTGEYHFNGIGADEAAGYAAVAEGESVGRGETYYLGRHYLGGLVSWSPDEENRLSLVLNSLVNLQDPSVALTPLLGYDLGQAARVSLGALVSFGDTPSFATLPPTLASEFGAYGTLAFTRLSIYF